MPGEGYLETILIPQKIKGMICFIDAVRYIEVSKPSVCIAINVLKEGGSLTKDIIFIWRRSSVLNTVSVTNLSLN